MRDFQGVRPATFSTAITKHLTGDTLTKEGFSPAQGLERVMAPWHMALKAW